MFLVLDVDYRFRREQNDRLAILLNDIRCFEEKYQLDSKELLKKIRKKGVVAPDSDIREWESKVRLYQKITGETP